MAKSPLQYFLPVRMGTRSVREIFESYEKEIPVYDEHIELAKLITQPKTIKATYSLMGNIRRKGELYAGLKDESFLPVWEKGDLLLLKDVEEEVLVNEDTYYFVMKDKRELAGKLTYRGEYFVFKFENEAFGEELVLPGNVLKMYKITGGIKKQDALYEWQHTTLNG